MVSSITLDSGGSSVKVCPWMLPLAALLPDGWWQLATVTWADPTPPHHRPLSPGGQWRTGPRHGTSDPPGYSGSLPHPGAVALYRYYLLLPLYTVPLSSSARPRGDTRRWPGGMWPPARLTTGATTAATTGVCTTTTPATVTTTMAPGTQRSHIPTIELTAEVSTLNHRLNISVYIHTNLHYIYLHKMKNKFIF